MEIDRMRQELEAKAQVLEAQQRQLLDKDQYIDNMQKLANATESELHPQEGQTKK